MDPEYAARYRELYERHWWWRARERFLLDRMERLAADGQRRRILDVGCGDALFFDELSRFGRVCGVEPDAYVLTDGPWRSSIHAGTLDTYDAEAPFDWILMLDVVEHLSDPFSTLERARSMAGVEGVLIVTVPALQALWTRHDDLNHHYTRYDRRTLSSLLEGAGWHPVEMKYFFHWLVIPKLLVRLLERLAPTEPRIERVPPEPINRGAYLVSRAEQRLVTPLGLPFGTSLFARCTARRR